MGFMGFMEAAKGKAYTQENMWATLFFIGTFGKARVS
jgi:hypothetical protein